MKLFKKERIYDMLLWGETFAELAVKIEDFIKLIKPKDYLSMSNIIVENNKYKVLIYYKEEEKEDGK